MSTPASPSSGSSHGAGRQWAHLGPAVSQDGAEPTTAEPTATDPTVAASPSGEPPAGEGTPSSPWADPPGDGPGRPGSAPAPVPGPSAGADERGGRSRPEPGRPGRLGIGGALTRALVALAVPLSLLALGVRLVATPLFLWIEYHRPGFPEDEYGFGAEDRMTLGSHGMDYILNWAPGSFLGEIRTPSGRAWFTPDEISHMTDVKWVLQIGLWAGVAVVVLALVMALLHRRDRDGLLGAVAVGGWLTVIAAALLAVVAAVAWQQFFAAFHGLLFADGTWTFSMSDTLIRLYPTQFWIDAAIVIGVIAVGGALLAALLAQRARTSRGRRRR
ncbi:DUF1461 domain-containing protein [Kocuria palustris]|uniref:lipoprotein intramolecular transacylase Lit n=1 Tax=Kocuria palustris TaxID=71999 RepID=UPI0011A88EB5|nr:DUF1461 domain-containing protein [Kocuria palustris]